MTYKVSLPWPTTGHSWPSYWDEVLAWTVQNFGNDNNRCKVDADFNKFTWNFKNQDDAIWFILKWKNNEYPQNR
jgi:hypothetical protein